MANKGIKAAKSIMRTVDPVVDRLAREVRRRIAAGMAPDKAMAEAIKATKFTEKLTDAVIKEARALVGTVKKDGPAFRKIWLNKVWTGDKMTLSERVNDLKRADEIKASIKASMKAGESWVDMANSLKDKNLQKADIAKHATELEQAARRAMVNSDPKLYTEYRSALKRSVSQVEKLAKDGAPTQRLKAAYQQVIDATETFSEKALDKAVDNIVREKARYNAERIARTESARAYIQNVYGDVSQDEQAIGIGYDLSPEHPRTDICDLHTSVDAYGLGKGVYPLSNLPPYPFHPSCICQAYTVYEGDVKANPKAVEKFLRSRPAEDKAALLGVQGAKDFNRNPGTWRGNLKNWEGLKPIDDLVEVIEY